MSENRSKITQLKGKGSVAGKDVGVNPAQSNKLTPEDEDLLMNTSDHQDHECLTSKKPAKGIYVLPNLITTAGLFAGFYAIMQARIGHFEAASLAIYAAMVMDIMDGRLARLTNTMSDFGSEYDSLSDMVSFGVAPALLMYEFVLKDLGRVGSLIAFVYIACAALRLARFNVAKVSDKRHFIGVPSPGAAAMIASIVWVCIDYKVDIVAIQSLLGFAVVLVAFSMVSNIPYRSFKDVDFRDKMPFIGLIILVLIIAIIYLDPPLAFLSIGTLYLSSGAVMYLYKLAMRPAKR